MSSSELSTLDQECRLFTQRLCGLDPTPVVLVAYRRAHETRSIDASKATRRERRLVAFAQGGAWSLHLADCYAALFARGSLLRKKLVLLLAILESTNPYSQVVDSPRPGSVIGFFAQAAGLALQTGLSALVAAPLVWTWGLFGREANRP